MGESGVIKQATEAKQKWDEASEKELADLSNMFSSMTISVPETLKIGDVVNWTPNGSYTWDKNLYASVENNLSFAYISGAETAVMNYTVATKQLYSGEMAENAENIQNAWNDGTNLDFTINQWKVISIDRMNNKIKLVPTSITIPLLLQGATGYNNGVKLLNDACEELYGGNKAGIEVHNMNIEDIEELMSSKTAIEEAKSDIGYGERYSDAYINNGVQYRNSEGEYIEKVDYPTIYAEEAQRKITNYDDTVNASNTGLGESEARSSFITRENEKVTKNAANAIVTKKVKTIHPARTFFYIRDYNTFTTALGLTNGNNIGIAEILLPNEDKTAYWLSSRNINTSIEATSFGLRDICFGCLDGCTIYNSGGIEAINIGFAYGLFPIVTISAGRLDKDNTNNTFTYTPAH